MSNPYSNLPDRQFWRRAVARVEPHELDPVETPSFRVTPTDRVATAGSCFAQHISRSLSRVGFDYWVPEAPSAEISAEEARYRNYGVFSCRYGNIYTTRQLLQLFEEAFGERRPLDTAWQRPDGRFVDPLRPQVEPNGFVSQPDVTESRRIHLDAVRTMFEGLDILVFTLGLTEAWRSRRDGTVYPLAPGVAGGSFDPAEHEFKNLSVGEVEHDLDEFLRRLRMVNPRSRIVLTVSPVPLIATYEPRHVLVSTTYSKSVLRVAAQTVVDAHTNVEYFPSFEIVTGNHAGGRYFEDDLREVNKAGVAHAMRTFLRHYASNGQVASQRASHDAGPAAAPPLATTAKARTPTPFTTGARPAQITTPLTVLNQPADDDIICDEESIDQIRP